MAFYNTTKPEASQNILTSSSWFLFYNPTTVSYTHLDVYKRQKQQCSRSGTPASDAETGDKWEDKIFTLNL